MQLIDSHCHIDGKDFDPDRDLVLRRAKDAGVGRLVVVGTGRDMAQISRAVALAENEPTVVATVGVHPHDAAHFPADQWRDLGALAQNPHVVAVGETGLDYHYDHSPRDAQADAFARQIRLAHEVQKPVVCHVRNAHAEALAILIAERAEEVGGVIHCFTGTPKEAASYVAHGFYISFSGIVTFPGKSADPIRQAVRAVPLDRILVETDAPFLAPVPMRGKRNEPAHVVHTARLVAETAGVSLPEFAAATVANTVRLFRLTG